VTIADEEGHGVTRDEAIDLVCWVASEWASEYGGKDRLGDIDEALEALLPGVYGQLALPIRATVDEIARRSAEHEAEAAYVLGGQAPLFDRAGAA